jgi:hypothetical protein
MHKVCLSASGKSCEVGRDLINLLIEKRVDLVLQAHGLAYVIAYCHRDGFEKTFRLDRIQRCWLAEE